MQTQRARPEVHGNDLVDRDVDRSFAGCNRRMRAQDLQQQPGPGAPLCDDVNQRENGLSWSLVSQAMS